MRPRGQAGRAWCWCRRPTADARQEADWQEVLAALPADLDGLARAYALVGHSLRLVAAWAAAAGVAELSDVALLGRLRGCASWLRTLVRTSLAAGGVAAPVGAAGRRLRLIDGSAISGPHSQGTDWRVHLAYDPVAQRPTAVEVTDAHGGGIARPLRLRPGRPRDSGSRLLPRAEEVGDGRLRPTQLLAPPHLRRARRPAPATALGRGHPAGTAPPRERTTAALAGSPP